MSTKNYQGIIREKTDGLPREILYEEEMDEVFALHTKHRLRCTVNLVEKYPRPGEYAETKTKVYHVNLGFLRGKTSVIVDGRSVGKTIGAGPKFKCRVEIEGSPKAIKRTKSIIEQLVEIKNFELVDR